MQDGARLAVAAALALTSSFASPAQARDAIDFTMDGVLDPAARLAFDVDGRSLHYAVRGGKFYVAANDAGEGFDKFIFITDSPGNLIPAPESKAGFVARWDVYLFDENDNNSAGIFGANSGGQVGTGANGGVLEGSFDYSAQFALNPDNLYVVAAAYQTQNGGVLASGLQVPPDFNPDGNIRPEDYGQIDVPLGWVHVGEGRWNNAFNWALAPPNAVGATALFGSAVLRPATAVIDAPTTVKAITYSTPFPITISGTETLTLDAVAGLNAITIHNGNHSISAPLDIRDGLSLSTFGVLQSMVFSGPINYAADTSSIHSGSGTVIMNGPITAGANAQLRILDGTTTANVDLNGLGMAVDGRLIMEHSQHVRSFDVNIGGFALLNDGPAPRVLRTGSVTTNVGRLDIADNGVIADYTSDSPFDSIRTQVVAGYNNGSWTGNGIVSFLARMTDNRRAVGYAEASAIGSPAQFFGEQIDDTSVLLRFTVTGDADLSSGVNIADFSRLAANFNQPSVWSSGDFDYDGMTDIGDFALLAANFNTSLPPARTAVPEPAAIGLTGLAVVVCRRRR